MKNRLTKTAYLNYLRCPQEFWLDHNEPLLSAREPITLEHEHLRQQGYAVEQYVKQLARFQPGEGIAVDFQRTFQTAELEARSDVVVTDKVTGETDIYEIKSAASVKDEHLDDVTFQRVVATRSGSLIRRAHVITLNGEYIRTGDIDVEQLFIITDVTETIAGRMAATAEQIKSAFNYLDSIPVPSLVDYCVDKKLDCRFIQLHFPDLPDYTVFDISFLKHDKRRELLATGIVDIKDVPDDFKLSAKQQLQVQVAKTREIVIDRDEIANRFDSWAYPLHFLDYETFAYAIPQFEGVKPFQQMCFQYSLHTIDRFGAELRHTEYLSRGDDRPPRVVANHLREAMSGSIGTVFVWYEAFEKGRNQEMADMFPDLADFFTEVNEKTYDLMKIFSENLYIHPDFKGKTSIKKVLPVLVPWLKYDDLEISEGLSATIKWFRAAMWTSLSEAERAKIFDDLLRYCELDTLAMVEIFKVLATL